MAWWAVPDPKGRDHRFVYDRHVTYRRPWAVRARRDWRCQDCPMMVTEVIDSRRWDPARRYFWIRSTPRLRRMRTVKPSRRRRRQH